MRIRGVGIRIVPIPNVPGDTPWESISDAERRIAKTRTDSAAFLAGRAAARRAVLAAYGRSDTDPFHVEISIDASGAPTARHLGAPSSDVVQLSIAHDGGIAIGVALVESADDAGAEDR
ncbi:hypothetical protein K8I61_12700 [bacterium]|nr:hypothetical protein [bacterium]